jgi:F-type H+-transporting ATPase subunit delta
VTPRAAAGRYAKALFEVALMESDVQQVYESLRQFADLVRSHEDLAHVLSNPAIPVASKRGLVKALLERMQPVPLPLAKVILLLTDRDRAMLVLDLAVAYRERLMDHLKIIRGTVTSAMPLDADRVQALEQGLQKATGRRVILEALVDPSIIGGVVTRLGSTVYDGSVVTQLQKMKQALIEGNQ